MSVRLRVTSATAQAIAFVTVLSGAGLLPSMQRPAAAQEPARAEANQLHAAIANGDVDALKYWLDVRHADPQAASASEPVVTPLIRCLTLASRVLDGPATGQGSAAAGGPEAVVGLRTLQDIIALLDAHGATISHDERRRFSAPVIRWYDDAVARPGTPATAAGDAAETTASSTPLPLQPAALAGPASPPPSGPAPSSTSTQQPVIGVASAATLVVVASDPKRSCNGAGHLVFLTNNALLPVTARVVTHTDVPGESKPRTATESIALEQGASWQLGCDRSATRGRVTYELKEWKY
jgi:hypothetical protein